MNIHIFKFKYVFEILVLLHFLQNDGKLYNFYPYYFFILNTFHTYIFNYTIARTIKIVRKC